MTKDQLIEWMGDELLRMTRALSNVAEKKMDAVPGWALNDGVPLHPEPEKKMILRCTVCRKAPLKTDDECRTGMCPPCYFKTQAPIDGPAPRPPMVVDIVPPTNVHEAVKILLQTVGEDPNREGLRETPERFRKAWMEMLSGYAVEIPPLFKLFTMSVDEMIIVKDINFTSMCEHHLLPFTGTAHVGYVADGKVIGLSKVARIVLAFAQRLQVQEMLTKNVTEAFDQHMTGIKGSACVIEASHTCMACRGVRLPGATMVTSSMTGVFRDKPEARAEFFACVRGTR